MDSVSQVSCDFFLGKIDSVDREGTENDKASFNKSVALKKDGGKNLTELINNFIVLRCTILGRYKPYC